MYNSLKLSVSCLNLPWQSELAPEIQKIYIYEGYVAKQIPLIQANLLPTQMIHV